MNTENRFLAAYMKNRLKPYIPNVTERELKQFLDDNGWTLYGTDETIRKFKSWRRRRAIRK